MYTVLHGPYLQRGSDVRKNKYKIVAGVYSEYRRLSLDAMHRVVRTVLSDALQGRQVSTNNR